MVKLIDILSDPAFMSGLSAASGQNPNTGLVEGLKLQMGRDELGIKKNLAGAEIMARKAQAREANAKIAETQYMRQALAMTEGKDAKETFRILQPIIGPEKALKVAEAKQKGVDLGMPGGADSPATVKEWNFYNSLPEEQKKSYLALKRAQQTLNLGGEYAFVDPTTNEISKTVPKTLAPEQQPETKFEQEKAKKVGAAEGESEALLKSMESKMPQLEDVKRRLSALGQLATYTIAGKTRDWLVRQSGIKVPDSAVARTKYMAVVDNEILPLLKDTFGSQFTENEGRSLRATLGDPDKSPEEKDAALEAFIESKMGTIGSLKRELGKGEGPEVGIVEDGYRFKGGDPSNPESWERVE